MTISRIIYSYSCGYYGGASGLVALNDTMELIRFPGGYFDRVFRAHYYVTDYQGNNIAVLAHQFEARPEQSMSYYPYGEPHRRPTASGSPSASTQNRYLFADKEYTDFGGESHSDFGPRTLNLPIPFFATQDRHADDYHGTSPYAYCAGNPIMLTDPTGNKIIDEFGIFSAYQIELQRVYDLVKDMSEGTELAEFLLNQNNQLNALKDSSQLYIIKQVEGDEGGCYYDPTLDAVCVNVVLRPNPNPFEIVAHELNHAWQFENGEISFGIKSPGILYDVNDEVESFNVSNQLYQGALYYDKSNSGKDANGNYYRVTKNLFYTPGNIYSRNYPKMPKQDLHLNKKTRKKLREINSNGMVDYYKGWKDDL